MELISLAQRGDLVEALTVAVAERGIADAAVVSVVGAVCSFTVSTMRADHPREAVFTSGRFAELSGNGEIVDGVPNIRVTCGLDGGQAVAGHLQAAEVGGLYAVHVYLLRL
ncbi:DUF296 domain-containing protein [Streptacidiphilus sp. PB12-B1b]|uniref:PCC domain-containing protein n=1 Tax=Streptacidiphilus sp. PB12-B1b TaxID=2705012 RepID=UPI0015F81286|nr:DUF296 domain-containing protein [Streptacidiphilus sp. PB12-B1b]QMU75147.1 DUF296 domain-containing protein [Streptacidiphilus sp. PB12-B1b]